ncbi:MAG: hypothetical protein D6704_05990 [Nitrospirae bacterium]|nr:MAG: hypothetical protein D6704_05990 [Nitrospirota bacterium]
MFRTIIESLAKPRKLTNSIRRSFSLATDKPAGSAIQVISFPDEQAEAAWIVRHIEEAIGGTSHYQHYKGKVHDVASQRARSFRDFAVLFRVQGIAKPLQDALTKSGIPYQFVGASRLFDRPMIKDLMAYLRVLIAPHDDVSLGHVLNRPPRGIGLQTQAALEAKAEDQEYSLFDILRQDNGFSPSQSGMIREFLQCLENLRSSMTAMPLSRFISHVAEVTGLKRWRTAQDPQHDRDVLLLRALAAKYDEHPPEQALQQFLVESALMEEADAYNSEIDAVTLATIHAVKGLEFTEVMLCGVEDEILPHINGDLEEERRLFYVGLTRAKEQVWLFHCRSRRVFGIRRACRVSRFLSEFDEALRTLTTVPDRSRRAKDTSQSDQLSLL